MASRRLCSVVRVKTKGDRERYMYQLASEAEEGLSNNQLKGAFRAIAEISGKASANQQCPINKDYGQPCASKEETLVRWQEHHTTMLNHPPATACPDLNQDVACACSVCSDASSLQEVRDVIARLKNWRTSGPDRIPSELLMCATEPISNALHCRT